MATGYLISGIIVLVVAVLTALIGTVIWMEHKVEDFVHSEHENTRRTLDQIYRQVAPHVADQIRNRGYK